MVAFGLVVLLGITGLAIDLGFGFAHRRQVQNAAEAGAIAGAKALARHVSYNEYSRDGIDQTLIDQLFGVPSGSTAIDLYEQTSEIWSEIESAAAATVGPFTDTDTHDLGLNQTAAPSWPSETGNSLHAWYVVPGANPASAPNGVEDTPIDGASGDVPDDRGPVGVRVEARLSYRTFFMRVLNIAGACPECDHVEVFATARAVLKPLGGNGPGEGGPFIVCGAGGPLPTPVAAAAPGRSVHFLAGPYAAAAMAGARGGAANVLAAPRPSRTPLPTLTPSPTPLPTNTPPPTPTPVPTLTPSPTPAQQGALLVGPTPTITIPIPHVNILATSTPGTVEVDPQWFGGVFRVYDDPQVLRNNGATCGVQNGSFRGYEQPGDSCDPPGVLPCSIDGWGGQRAVLERNLMGGINAACTNSVDSCVTLLPIATNFTGQNCNNNTCPFTVAAYGCFYLQSVPSQSQGYDAVNATLLPACESSGQAGDGTINPDNPGPFTFKLVEDCQDPSANTCVY